MHYAASWLGLMSQVSLISSPQSLQNQTDLQLIAHFLPIQSSLRLICSQCSHCIQGVCSGRGFRFQRLPRLQWLQWLQHKAGKPQRTAPALCGVPNPHGCADLSLSLHRASAFHNLPLASARRQPLFAPGRCRRSARDGVVRTSCPIGECPMTCLLPRASLMREG